MKLRIDFRSLCQSDRNLECVFKSEKLVKSPTVKGMSVKCLEEGWLVKKPEPEKRDPHTLTLEQQKWYDWARTVGICIDTPSHILPTKMGVLAVPIPIKDRRPFDPPYDLVAIDVAMREYPIPLQ